MRERTTFGSPVTDSERVAAATRASTFIDGNWKACADTLLVRIADDQVFSFGSGRWLPGEVEPDLYVPGDVAALRAYAGSPTYRSAMTFRDAARSSNLDPGIRDEVVLSARSALGRVAALYAAVPFFLAPDMVEGLAGSTPPDEADVAELRLPFPIVGVYFGADFAVPENMAEFGPVAAAEERRQEYQAGIVAALGGDDPQRSLLTVAENGTATISGVVLFAGPDGIGLADDVLWLVTVPDVAEWEGTVAENDRMRGLVWGSRSAATLEPIVENLAAAVAMLPWNLPGDPPDLGDTDRDRRRALRTGKGRRAYNRGDLSAVRTVQIAPSTTAASHARAERSHQSPVTHLRRGHWRRSRVGQRDDWTYRLVWIPPTVVNPGGAPDRAAVRTYVLPTPARRPDPNAPNGPTGSR